MKSAKAEKALPPGRQVEYYSQTSSRWRPALVLGFDRSSGTYQLDIHPAADPRKVRPVAENAGATSRSRFEVAD
eukprot:g33138.t1